MVRREARQPRQRIKGYGTTNADAGVGIGMKSGDSEISQKRLLISQQGH